MNKKGPHLIRSNLYLNSLRNRMNVAITRARELLIVIGNGSVLKYDTYWKAFLQFALRNKMWVFTRSIIYPFDAYPIDMLVLNWILRWMAIIFHDLSAREALYICYQSNSPTNRSDYIRTKASELEEEDQGVAIAGGIAREVLRDGGG